jgi:hypothetical protein
MVVDVHEMKETEVAAALTLTKRLAEFEGWADTITSDVDQVPRDVFQTTPPKFHYLVATVDNQDARGHLLGIKLMDVVKQVGRDHDCGVITWHVKSGPGLLSPAGGRRQHRLVGLPGEH